MNRLSRFLRNLGEAIRLEHEVRVVSRAASQMGISATLNALSAIKCGLLVELIGYLILGRVGLALATILAAPLAIGYFIALEREVCEARKQIVKMTDPAAYLPAQREDSDG